MVRLCFRTQISQAPPIAHREAERRCCGAPFADKLERHPGRSYLIAVRQSAVNADAQEMR
jgi:hypothetical protein